MSRHALALLRERIHGDPDLARHLASLPDAGFIADITRIGRELGFDIEEADLEEASAERSRAWSMRWIH